MADILGQIANPNIADVAGALDYRQKKMQADEDKRKELLTNKLAGQALSSGLKDGTPMAELAKANPQAYITVAKHLGIDPADGDGVHQMTVDVHTINNLAQNDPQQAIAYMQSEKERRSQLGMPTKYIDDALAHVQQNAPEFFRSLKVMDQTWNPPQAKEGFTLGEGQVRYDANGRVIAAVAPKPTADKNVDTADNRRQVNQDVSKIINPVNDVVLAAKDLDALKASNSPSSQVAAVFKFMKSLDPTSAVRESEQGQVYEAQGAGAALAGRLNKLLGEGALNKAAFEDLVTTAKHLANSSVDNANGQVDSYLSTYENTLPDSFKGKLKERLPKRFDVSAPPSSSIDDLVNKYAK